VIICSIAKCIKTYAYDNANKITIADVNGFIMKMYDK